MVSLNQEVLVRLSEVTVEIPLRGVKQPFRQEDPRILKNKSGKLVLRALHDISLEIRRGERVGILGGNGHGKTTLLKLIGGMLPAVSGKVEVFGSARLLLNINAGTNLSLTGKENARLYYALLGIKNLSLSDFLDNVAEFSELGPFFDMPLGTYSAGMQSRLQFAMNTVESADLLLLDEWLGVSDRHFKKRCNDACINCLIIVKPYSLHHITIIF